MTIYNLPMKIGEIVRVEGEMEEGSGVHAMGGGEIWPERGLAIDPPFIEQRRNNLITNLTLSRSLRGQFQVAAWSAKPPALFVRALMTTATRLWSTPSGAWASLGRGVAGSVSSGDRATVAVVRQLCTDEGSTHEKGRQ